MPTKNSTDKDVVKQVTELLTKGNAHADFDQAVENLSIEIAGIKPEKLPYSIWQLVEHIRITQWDILEFSRNPEYKSPKWPEEYWPKEKAPSDETQWKNSLQEITQHRNDFIALLDDTTSDLYTPFPHGDGQNLLREALLIADHTSYHLGEIIVIRRLLNDWKS